MVTIIILSRHAERARAVIECITATHSRQYEYSVIVVNDGFSPGALDGYPCTRVVDGKKPFNFSRNVNIGIGSAHITSDILLLNDDVTVVTENAISALADVAHSRPTIGIVSPVFNRRERNPRQRWGVLTGNEAWIETEHTLTFAACYLKRTMIDRIGLLDERFHGYGYEDNDYCMRAWQAGFELAIRPQVLMMHGDALGRASLTFRERADFLDLIVVNRRLFIAKWSCELLGLDSGQAATLNEFLERGVF